MSVTIDDLVSRNDGSLDFVEKASLSEIIALGMLDELNEDQLEYAPHVVNTQITEGERSLYMLHVNTRNHTLQERRPIITPTTIYLDYLELLWDQKPGDVTAALNRVRHSKSRSRIDSYLKIHSKTPKRQRNDGLHETLKEIPHFIEVAYTRSRRGNRKVNLVIARRKDSDRAIEKMAYRILTNSEDSIIDDWFGYKIVTYRKRDVQEILDRLYPIISRAGYVISEIDNKYEKPKVNCNLVQIKIHPVGQPGRLREVVVTDAINMYVDEMDHVQFRASQENKLNQLVKRPKYRTRFREYIARAQKLMGNLPINRRRILTPGELFIPFESTE